VSLAISLALATLAARPLIDTSLGNPPERYAEQTYQVDWQCQSLDRGVEVCLHPAFSRLMDESTAAVKAMVVPVAGLPGVDSVWRQIGPWRTDHSGIGQIQVGGDIGLIQGLAEELMPVESMGAGGPSRPASQVVILTWLATRGATDRPDWLNHVVGVPTEVALDSPETVDTAAGIWYPPVYDEASLAEWDQRIDDAVSRFEALSPAEQRAWLEANWTELRAGNLTIDDLP
jgi:hypothetical protein